MYDYDLILMNGAAVTTTALDTPASGDTDRSESTGAAVIDLGETGAKGLAAVMILSDLEGTADNYTLTSYLEASDVLAFTSDTHRLCSFDLLGTNEGVIVGSETPCTIVTRFDTDKRYVRFNGTVSNTFSKIKVYLTPFPFKLP